MMGFAGKNAGKMHVFKEIWLALSAASQLQNIAKMRKEIKGLRTGCERLRDSLSAGQRTPNTGVQADNRSRTV